MSIDTIPNQNYFNGLIYNSNFYSSGNTVTLNYVTQNFLKRTGTNATSNAITTSFSGNVSVNGLSSVSDTNVGGNANITGNTNVGGNANVTGNINLTGTLDSSISTVSLYPTPSSLIIGSSSSTLVNLGASLFYGNSLFRSNFNVLGISNFSNTTNAFGRTLGKVLRVCLF